VAGPCTSLGFDSSGKYLAVGTESAIVVREVKPWTEVVSVARGVAGLAFAADARALVGVDAGGGLAEVAK